MPGSIRGASHELGHRLRDATVERATSKQERVRVAIVGAGPSGLSAAWRLEQLGERSFAVFDLEAQPGGTSAYGTDGVVAYPWGAHYVPAPTADNRALVRLLGEVGALGAEDPPAIVESMRIREPEERLFIDGAWQEGLFPMRGAGREDIAELERFTREVDAWVGRRDARGRRAFTIPVARCSDDAAFTALDRMSASQYLARRGYRSKRLRWYVEYACRDDYGLLLEHTSAWAMLFYFAARVPAPGQRSAPFVAWPEGNGRLVAHLARVAGQRLRLGALVTDIVPHADRVELGVFDARSGTLSRLVADYAIVAVPKFVAQRIVRPLREARPAHLREFSYGSWLVANLHLGKRPRSVGFGMAWDNVIYDSPSLGYVVATHQARADQGPTVWTYYQPLVDEDPNRARQRLLELDHAAFCDAILSDLERAHEGLADAVERIDVWRWGHAMVRPTPGFIWGPARTRAAEHVSRVHFAHSDLSGVALFEEAQYHGVASAEAVMRAEGREFESLIG